MEHNNSVNSQQYADHHIRQCEGTHKHTSAETAHNVNASPSMDVSVNFGSLSSRSLQRKDVAAGAKGVPHRCVTNSRAISRGPDRCDKHGAARQVAKDGAVVWCMQGGSVSGAPALFSDHNFF